jgi:hypothetical protein
VGYPPRRRLPACRPLGTEHSDAASCVGEDGEATFVLTADRRTAIGKLGVAVEARLFLRPVDHEDQRSLGLRAGRVPTDMPAGRGFGHEGRAETQICLLTAEATGESQVAAIAALA